MQTYNIGRNSRKQLDTCHIDLVKITELAIKRTSIDFGVSEGHRPVARQKMLFDQGKSKIDGINKLGKHNLEPSEALDFFAYHPEAAMRRRLAYDKVHLAYIGGVFESCARELYEKGEITHLLRWGANWDKDGVLLFDQSFNDMPHVELYKP